MPVAHVSAIELMQSPSMQLAMMNAQLASQQMQSRQQISDICGISQLLGQSPSTSNLYRQDNAAGVSEMRREWFKRDVELGEEIIANLAFWGEIPVLGKFMKDRLAEKLERISDRIELSIGSPA